MSCDKCSIYHAHTYTYTYTHDISSIEVLAIILRVFSAQEAVSLRQSCYIPFLKNSHHTGVPKLAKFYTFNHFSSTLPTPAGLKGKVEKETVVKMAVQSARVKDTIAGSFFG